MFWRRQSSGTSFHCSNCGKSYSLTPIEIRYLKAQELNPPKLCRGCRIGTEEDSLEDEARPRLIVGK